MLDHVIVTVTEYERSKDFTRKPWSHSATG